MIVKLGLTVSLIMRVSGVWREEVLFFGPFLIGWKKSLIDVNEISFNYLLAYLLIAGKRSSPLWSW